MKVAVVGASPNPERYSNKAIRMLTAHGHEVIPVNPGHAVIEGLPSVAELGRLPSGSVDTVTMYVGPAHSGAMEASLVALKPRRVIFNPGAENPVLAASLGAKGIQVEDACTLVLLQTGQF